MILNYASHVSRFLPRISDECGIPSFEAEYDNNNNNKRKIGNKNTWKCKKIAFVIQGFPSEATF